MTVAATRPGPNGRARPSLGDQLDRLDGILDGLSDALNESVTAAVSAAVGKAVREAVEVATNDLTARSLLPAPVIGNLTVTATKRPTRHLTNRFRTVMRWMLVPLQRVAGWWFRQFGPPLAAIVRRAVRVRWLLGAAALGGVVAGAVFAVSGPVAGAALGGLAGAVIALRASRPG